MTVVVCHGVTSEAHAMDWLCPAGLKRPYTVVTMHPLWWDVATALDLPRMFFTDKLRMMQFCLGKRIISLMTLDHTEETIGMAASFHAMGADVEYTIHSDSGG